MDIAVPSRFACLKIEDDDTRPQSVKPKEVKKKVEKKLPVKKSEKDVKLQEKPGAKKSSSNKQPASTAGKRERKKPNSQQWEEWKQKDSELVNGHFEEDLQSAILLSKLDYEHNKDMYKVSQEADEKEKGQGQNKKKKSKAMSLDQFLSSKNGADKNSDNLNSNSKMEIDCKDQNFFKKVQMEAKEELNKEHVKEKRKKREANIDEVISMAQCQQKSEQKDAVICALQLELNKTKSEISAVKERNKTLCGMLGHGEMKDKADVLLELERVYAEKNDLAEEVSRLHVLLEQERSKVAALTSDSHNNKHKDKNKK